MIPSEFNNYCFKNVLITLKNIYLPFFFNLQNGARECEQVQCPKLDCSPAVQIDGDCCPRCMQETDACAVSPDQIRRTESCEVDGHRKFYPTPFRIEKLDRCTTCVCKVRVEGISIRIYIFLWFFKISLIHYFADIHLLKEYEFKIRNWIEKRMNLVSFKFLFLKSILVDSISYCILDIFYTYSSF